MLRTCRLLLLLVIASVAAVGCRPSDQRTVATAALRDDFGTVIAFGKAPERIVSLNPTTTEILFAIGAGKRLVGRSQYDTFPDSATSVPSLGLALRPNVEAVIATKPDLVILYASEDNRPAFDRLRQAGINTFAFKLDSIEQFRRDTRVLGRLTGDSVRANTLVDTVSATLERVRAATASLPHPTVFLPVWDKPVIAIGGGSFMSELLEIAGARNVYGAVHTPSVTVAMEDVVAKNPDFVMTGAASAAKMRTTASWQTVPAIHAGHVLVLDLDRTTRPSVQLGEAAVAIAELIHPGSVP
ncbi:MAG TPA: helical backbone metal receptor [Gemmatimonadaceae bacterium]|nr:helical backbone metal receptor [Gemmatimonadaceae bacterium]